MTQIYLRLISFFDAQIHQVYKLRVYPFVLCGQLSDIQILRLQISVLVIGSSQFQYLCIQFPVPVQFLQYFIIGIPAFGEFD